MGKEPPAMITREEFKIEVAREQLKIYSSRLEGMRKFGQKRGINLDLILRKWIDNEQILFKFSRQTKQNLEKNLNVA